MWQWIPGESRSPCDFLPDEFSRIWYILKRHQMVQWSCNGMFHSRAKQFYKNGIRVVTFYYTCSRICEGPPPPQWLQQVNLKQCVHQKIPQISSVMGFLSSNRHKSRRLFLVAIQQCLLAPEPGPDVNIYCTSASKWVCWEAILKT